MGNNTRVYNRFDWWSGRPAAFLARFAPLIIVAGGQVRFLRRARRVGTKDLLRPRPASADALKRRLAAPGVSAEQVKPAREVDLLSYLRANEPGELVKTKQRGEYRTATHGSLVISNGKWIWNRGNCRRADKSAFWCATHLIPRQSCGTPTRSVPKSAPARHATFQRRVGWPWDGHRLSLGGTASVALTSFLERNPQIKRIMLHLDNDAAGSTAARMIKEELAADKRFKRIRVSYNPPRGGKDYNDALIQAIIAEKEQHPSHRRKADIFI